MKTIMAAAWYWHEPSPCVSDFGPQQRTIEAATTCRTATMPGKMPAGPERKLRQPRMPKTRKMKH